METRGHGKAQFHSVPQGHVRRLLQMGVKEAPGQVIHRNFCAVEVDLIVDQNKPARHILRQRGRAHSDGQHVVKQIEGKWSTAPTGMFGIHV